MRNNKPDRERHGRKSLQRQTTVLLVAVVSFFCIIFSITTYIMERNTENDYKTRASENAVNNAVAAINASLMNYNCLTRLLMVNDRIVDFLKAQEMNNDLIYEARRGIYEIQNLYSNIDSVYIFRVDGAYVSTERAQYEIDMESDEVERILAARGSAVVSINGNGMITKCGGEQLLTMARAIYDINSQKQTGLLVMNISSEYFESVIAAQGAENMCIMDKNGAVLCGDAEIGECYDSCFPEQDLVYSRIRLRNRKTILASKLAVEPIIVLCAATVDASVIPKNNMVVLLIPMAAFMLSIFACVWFMAVNIARPITALERAMERTKSSGWLEKLDAEMPDNELGGLADSYNIMIEYLNTLFEKLLENEKEVQKAEMRVLQEQIKPHFLYNTLETISYMAVQENADQVHNALEVLGNFYRNFLNHGDREIPLRQELKITKDYLALQKLRYKDVFQDEYDIGENILDCMIPKLILQPLVENAIYHGIRQKGEKGIIRVTAREEQGSLHIIVYDTGIGMSQEKIRELLSTSDEGEGKDKGGFGLRGTISRIRYYCDCEGQFAIYSEPCEYTEIHIKLPVKRG